MSTLTPQQILALGDAISNAIRGPSRNGGNGGHDGANNRCWFCGQRGHNRRNCPRRHNPRRRPQRSQRRRQARASAAATAAAAAVASIVPPPPPSSTPASAQATTSAPALATTSTSAPAPAPAPALPTPAGTGDALGSSDDPSGVDSNTSQGLNNSAPLNAESDPRREAMTADFMERTGLSRDWAIWVLEKKAWNILDALRAFRLERAHFPDGAFTPHPPN
ncbi:hypothetical protein NW762_007805 [Fusarium torreyae]|uniref:CCHC-type domain-containing protein n=1 Tax=Fusarium torreyae TaxID=1237075 RepID=A0A9W8S0A1_9HYPO|nr:hypothetical protein NW762_007805 [Fusarium torreyae]